MALAFKLAFADGATAAVIMGTDCPELDAEVLDSAFANLGPDRLVLGPARDGGYYLIGLTGPAPKLFEAMPWGGDQVISETLRRADAEGLAVHQLRPLNDIDRPEDLARAKAFLSS